MTTWKEAYERLCSGKDDTCNAIIAWLVSAGWKPDRIIKNLNPCCLQRAPAPRAPAHDFSAV